MSLRSCSQINEDTLEDVLLFVGILSGRGYRHRRLAVREAWANQCQMPGVSVCRFMLSEDEVTPQVRAKVLALLIPHSLACRSGLVIMHASPCMRLLSAH